MVTLLTVIHIVVCLFLILVVLLQAGKGGGMGIAFGGAGSQTVFGSSGAGNFLTRLTSITATVFLLTSLALAHYSSRQDSKRLQQLASEKAAEKKSEDEKAAKLKADMEKMRAASATGKDGGAGAVPAESAPGTTNATPPLQLKMPGETSRPGAGNSNTPSVPTPPTTVPRNAPAAPATGETTAKPVVKRRKVPVAPAADAPGTVPSAPAQESAPAPASETAPAPAQPAPAQ
jgi:preprotein translocase subunit SecG